MFCFHSLIHSKLRVFNFGAYNSNMPQILLKAGLRGLQIQDCISNKFAGDTATGRTHLPWQEYITACEDHQMHTSWEGTRDQATIRIGNRHCKEKHNNSHLRGHLSSQTFLSPILNPSRILPFL